jgi:hypothetical protein
VNDCALSEGCSALQAAVYDPLVYPSPWHPLASVINAPRQMTL